jgi:hypothetical protein
LIGAPVIDAAVGIGDTVYTRIDERAASMAARKIPTTFRLSPETRAIIAAIADIREGLSATRVVENAVGMYGRKVLGRRMADLVSPRARPGRAGGGKS